MTQSTTTRPALRRHYITPIRRCRRLRRSGDGSFAVATGWQSGMGAVMQGQTGGQG